MQKNYGFRICELSSIEEASQRVLRHLTDIYGGQCVEIAATLSAAK